MICAIVGGTGSYGTVLALRLAQVRSTATIMDGHVEHPVRVRQEGLKRFLPRFAPDRVVRVVQFDIVCIENQVVQPGTNRGIRFESRRRRKAAGAA
mgnify:CR=1 FL=1